MRDLETARILLAMANRDLLALEILANAEHLLVETCGFHAQQAVEKALKAWLAILGQKPPRTHSLSVLLQLLETLGVDVEPLWDFSELTPFAIQFRYESLSGMDTDFDLRDWLERVRELVERVKALRRELNDG